MRRAQLADGEYYHVYNRGVERRDVFGSHTDYERFLFDLYALNDRRPFLNSQYHYRGLASIERLAAKARRHDVGQRRIPLVDLACFCLLPNHFHLLLRQRGDDGIPLFMQKLGTAYTMYFNEKYRRSGGLFQGTYKAVHISHDRYFLPLSRYIHLNPLDLLEPNWKNRGVRRAGKGTGFLMDYPWSSYADYVSSQRFPLLLDPTLVRNLVGKPAEYQAYVEAYRPVEVKKLSFLTIEV